MRHSLKTNYSLLLFIILFFVINTNLSAQGILKIGAKAPLIDQRLEDVTGRILTLKEVSQQNGLLVIFSSNTCPWVIKWEDRFSNISSTTKANRIGLIALNSNEDYRNKGDGLDDMVKHSKKMGFDFPYAIDKNHQIADAFGAIKTPYVYLFNGNLELIYVGPIDDNPNDASAVKASYLNSAIEKMLAGEKVEQINTKSLGCTIKRVS